MEADKSPFERIRITTGDLFRAVGGVIVDRVSTPFPLDIQRGASAMLDDHLDQVKGQQSFAYDSEGNWHDPEPWDVVGPQPDTSTEHVIGHRLVEGEIDIIQAYESIGD